MDSFLKGIAILGLSVLGLVSLEVAQAASFDCSKARTRVEKLICHDPVISKLDSQLGKVYKSDLAKANPDQKKMLITDELLWLKNMRDLCSTQTCFKHAYWTRLAELKTYFDRVKVPTSASNKDKAAIGNVCSSAWVQSARNSWDNTGSFPGHMGRLSSEELQIQYQQIRSALAVPGGFVKTFKKWESYKNQACNVSSSIIPQCPTGVAGSCDDYSAMCNLRFDCEQVRHYRRVRCHELNGYNLNLHSTKSSMCPQ